MWVGRRRDDVAEEEEEVVAGGGGAPSSVPPPAKDNEDGATQMAEKDRTASSTSTSTGESKMSTMPDGGDGDSSLALFELNRIKRRLPRAPRLAHAHQHARREI